MMKRVRRTRATDLTRDGKIADYALAATIILAPILGGSSNLYTLPILDVAAIVAAVATIRAAKKLGASLHLTPMIFALFALSLLTLLQAVPLPAAWVGTLSPKAASLRAFAGDAPDAFPLTYEWSATFREAAKLALYGIVALVAYERARVRRSILVVTVPVVVAGLSAAGLAALHRILGIEKVLGVLSTRRPTSEMLTTFANANHSAGFMALSCLVALGFAVSRDASKRSERVGGIVAAGLCAFMALLTVSRGGIGALIIGIALFGALVVRRRSRETKDLRAALREAMPVAVALAIAIPVMLAFSTLEQLLGDLSRTGEVDLGPEGKLAAFKDALPMIKDHLFFGIGRGSYASLYTHYKESPAQLIFAYPENIVVQLLADWGVVLGSVVLVAFLFALGRRLLRAEVAAIGALAGVAAVALQNVVDFSLELPGVALPVAAILGATSVGVVGPLRIPVRLGSTATVLIGGASAFLLILTGLAFAAGDYDHDLEKMQDLTRETEMAPLEDFVAIAQRHPTNAYLAALVSYAAETSTPPQLSKAAEWINRALYLAPTYADAHLAAGRLLVRSNHREQGFTAFREAWRLSAPGHRTPYIYQMARLATGPEELLEAVPRKDAELDVPDDVPLLMASRVLRRMSRKDWCPTFLGLIDVDQVPADILELLAMEALGSGDLALSDRSLNRLRELKPNEPEVVALYTRGLMRKGEIELARAEAKRLLAISPKNPAPGLKMLIEIAFMDNDDVTAGRLFARLTEATPPTRQGQVELARFESEIDMRSGNPTHALKTLSRAIDLAPEALDLRTLRAQILRNTGHLSPAASDLKYVLARQPENGSVQHMLAEVESMRMDHPLPKKTAPGGEAQSSDFEPQKPTDWVSLTSELEVDLVSEYDPASAVENARKTRAAKSQGESENSHIFGF